MIKTDETFIHNIAHSVRGMDDTDETFIHNIAHSVRGMDDTQVILQPYRKKLHLILYIVC